MNNIKYKDALYDLRYISDLKDMIVSSAKLYPDRTAYYVKETHGGEFQPISYRKTAEDIDNLGTGLINLGLAGKKIAIIGENSYEWIISYLATVNGTGVVVPLDKELPNQEIINLLRRAKVSAIVYSLKMRKTIMELLPEIEALGTVEYVIPMKAAEASGSDDVSAMEAKAEKKLTLADIMQIGKKALEGGDRRFVDAVIDREAMCTLLFTSGTTGLAKGVMLSHKNISQNVYNMSKYVLIAKGGIGLSVLPMHHSYEMTCHILPAFYMGVSVAICEGLKYIQKNMAEIHATVMLGVPLVFENMHRKVLRKAENSGKLEKMRKAMELSKRFKLYNHQKLIRHIFKDVHEATGGCIDLFIVGGAAIDPQVVEDFQAMGFPMIQGYGMTENAPIIALNRSRYSKCASAGPAMPATEIRIIDEDENGVGEIITRGPSVMVGYYENPAATAEAIVDGWLHTGDYGYFDEDGYLYISGRKKNVIVTKNGKNVFPEEVEFYLTENDYIAEALVHGVDDGGDTVIRAEIFPDFERLREDLGELSDEDIYKFYKKLVDEINEKMTFYKQVKRIGIRRTDFVKTTTRKIKRFAEENFRCDIDLSK